MPHKLLHSPYNLSTLGRKILEIDFVYLLALKNKISKSKFVAKCTVITNWLMLTILDSKQMVENFLCKWK